MELPRRLLLLVSLGVSLSCLAPSAGPDEQKKRDDTTKTKAKKGKKGKKSKKDDTSTPDGPHACPPDCKD
jgi:hypothetical protein